MDQENNKKLERIRKALFSVEKNDEDDILSEESKVLKESKKTILRGNFRKDLQAG